MEKINFVNNQTSAGATTMNTFQNNIENAINSVVESGSNTNGNYVKYADGTMICYGSLVVDITFNAWGNIAGGDWDGSFSFPKAFTSTPVLSCTNADAMFASPVTRCIASKSAITRISLLRPSVQSSPLSITINYLAIGKWK